MASSFSARVLLSVINFSFSTPAISQYPPEKVSLSIYYETLCPACSEFIVYNLSKIFESSILGIVDLNLVPYGNAKQLWNRTTICTHGSDECMLNTIQACNFIVNNNFSEWISCFERRPEKRRIIIDCYLHGLGEKLESQCAMETSYLYPPLEYLPWVTVNNIPLRIDFQNFVKYICKAYKGSPHRNCQWTPYL
ncbi:hypothetical protein MKW98_026643 [Papaver atlanticum]|uniref:Gamma-interferon-inducible lysosomal thiol reductase n=1 Tax=Papaver atlanticum TaxID=357466 RepID=A0AAD4RZL4_9MAGN|nr:hypothetical protein MKW98_026643 [Papaver atlanticum]